MIHIVIPARFGSTRLPGKALADICGRPLVWHTWQRALAVAAESHVVATDEPRIEAVLREAGADVAMTRSDHLSGTDRLAEVAEQRGWSDDSIVVNLQGDEPMMPPENLAQVAKLLALDSSAVMATLCEPIVQHDEFVDPSVVKVVVNQVGHAMYFSRSPIPFFRDPADEDSVPSHALRHIGLYAYRTAFLKRFSAMESSPLERCESLEQLRVLDNGDAIAVAEASKPVPGGVDTPADLERIRALMEAPA